MGNAGFIPSTLIGLNPHPAKSGQGRYVLAERLCEVGVFFFVFGFKV